MSCRFVFIQMISTLALVGLLGCGPKGKQADASTARTTLQRALDAWKAGDQFEDFQKTSPPVTVVEPLWEKGTKLVKYDLDSSDFAAGFDKKFSVKLSLEDGSGKKSEQKASYTVSTSPHLVIVRADEGD